MKADHGLDDRKLKILQRIQNDFQIYRFESKFCDDPQ